MANFQKQGPFKKNGQNQVQNKEQNKKSLV